jgi:hypothetical protein
MLNRTCHLLSKMVRHPGAAKQIAETKSLLFKVMLYFTNDDVDLFKQCLIVLHGCCKLGNFGELCRETHGFPDSTWDSYIKKIKSEFKKQHDAEDWNLFINICASITAFNLHTAFPSRTPDFQELIVPLIKVCANKTDMLRKNAAVCLARLSNDEGNKKILVANHGLDVLNSLKNFL